MTVVGIVSICVWVVVTVVVDPPGAVVVAIEVKVVVYPVVEVAVLVVVDV